MPLAMEPTLHRENTMIRAPRTNWLYVIGRLRPGAKLPQVSAHMTSELQQYLALPGNLGAEQKTADIKKQVIRVTSGASGVNTMQTEYHPGLYILLAASAAILLIACANVANLLLARRTVTRLRTSLQLAVGATPGRIIRSGRARRLVLA